MTSLDTSIGDRIHLRRKARGWSQRFAADRAGISHTTWSRIERGLRGADNRFLIADIARALQCSVTDLTGQPYQPVDADGAHAEAGATAVRHALAEIDLTEPALCKPAPLPELIARTADVQRARRAADDPTAARLLPNLLRELHARTYTPDRDAALRLLVRVAAMSSGLMRYLATGSDMWLAAERAHQAATALDDPVLIGLAAYERAGALIRCGSYARALDRATRAADALRPHTDRPGGTEVFGMLTLTGAFTATGLHRRDDGAGWLADARNLAARVGDTETFGLYFGPTNVAFWSVAIEVDGGDPGRAVKLARNVTPTRIDALSRQATYWIDTGRALARIGKDVEAVRALLIAERLAARRVRWSPLARETVRTLLERSNRAGARGELVGLCERMVLPT